MVDLPLSTFTPSTGAPHAFHVPVLLTPATCRPLSGLRTRCCAAPRWPRRCHGDGAGRGQAEAWGGPGDGPSLYSLSSLPFLLSSLFAFDCFPSPIIFSLFPLYAHLFSSPFSSPRIFFFFSCIHIFPIHIPFSFTPALPSWSTSAGRGP